MGVYIFTPEDLVRYGSASREQIAILEEALRRKSDILIVGSNRSGKTKLVEAMIHLLPDTWKIAVVTAYNEFKPFKDNIFVINTEFDGRPTKRRTKEVIEQIKRINPTYVVIDTIHTVDVPAILDALIDDYPFMVTSLALSKDVLGEVKHWLKISESVFKRFELVVRLDFDFRTHSRSIDGIYLVKDGMKKVA
ncbi:Flp pilus assembly complex ATPase component TadA [Palaeococcus ferrophilus]|uniref:Flp pilus assembly complex ATPase component TadA n=1 Tax=Palaeococcus ferrophilus TaxID=83868 RepID=UPI00064F2E21|nr:Flp pilus assembly complex ATPase component TadA [Palaeococcus ferrophilus]